MDALQDAMLQYRARRMFAKHSHDHENRRSEQNQQKSTLNNKCSSVDDFNAGATRTVSGSTMIAFFADAVATQLSPLELQGAIQSFKDQGLQGNPADLESRLASELERFREEEIQITGESRDRLARPSGPARSDLGIILHCQSNEGNVGEFWDEENPTIQTLAKKGLSPDRNWMSHEVLDILPLPFLVVAGTCPRKKYETRAWSTTRHVTVTISEGLKIDYDLDCHQGILKRVAVFVAHPAVGFFRPNTSNDDMVRLDSALNLFLHILAIDHVNDFYVTNLSSSSRGIPGCAPSAKVHEYRRLEEQLGRPLQVQEYDAEFLLWVQRYLKRSAHDTATQVGSVSHDLYETWKASLSKSFEDPKRKREHSRHNRINNARRYGWEFKEYWHGQKVTVHNNGVVRLHISSDQKALSFHVSKQAQAICKGSRDSPTILFNDEGLHLTLGAVVIFKKIRQQLSRLTNLGAEGLEQLDKELLLLSTTNHQPN